MSDTPLTEEHLARLVNDLAADPGYASGARRFPRRVSDAEGAAIAEGLAAEFDVGSARRAELAAAAGLSIYCRSGCASCCDIMVMAYRPEAAAIAGYLRGPEGAAALAHFRAAYPLWRAAVGDVPERLARLFLSGPPAEYDRLHLWQWGRKVRCAFNQEGRCTIYPVRPLSCRNAHALDTDERCRAESPQPAAAVQFVPLDDFLKQATRLLRAAHNAGGHQRNRQEAVCAAVARVLAEG